MNTRLNILLLLLGAAILSSCSRDAAPLPAPSSSPSSQSAAYALTGKAFLQRNLPEIQEQAMLQYRGLSEKGRDMLFLDVMQNLYLFTNSFSTNQITNLIAAMLPGVTDIDIRSPQAGATPLLLAAERSPYLVKLLIEKGADVNQSDRDGRTVLMKAAARQDEPVVRYLLEQGAKTAAVDSAGNTALEAALRPYMNMPFSPGIVSMVRLLLQYGADPNRKGPDGDSPLCLAAINGLPEVAEVLLKEGADVSQTSQRGNTALMCAVNPRSGFSDDGLLTLVQLLLDRHAPVNQQNENGDTALHILLAKNLEGQIYTPQTVALLLRSGAVTQLTNKQHQTAASLARQIPNQVIQGLLSKSSP